MENLRRLWDVHSVLRRLWEGVLSKREVHGAEDVFHAYDFLTSIMRLQDRIREFERTPALAGETLDRLRLEHDNPPLVLVDRSWTSEVWKPVHLGGLLNDV